MIENGRCYWGEPFDDVALAGYGQAYKWEIIRIPEGEDRKYKLRLLMVVESTWREAKEIATFSYRAGIPTSEQGSQVVPQLVPGRRLSRSNQWNDSMVFPRQHE
jgi:hypothetical protein